MWKGCDPQAAQASDQIRDQVEGRYGIDVNNTGADESAVSEALTKAQQSKAAANRTDEAVAGAAVAGAAREDRDATAGKSAEPAYDSPARRRHLAESLEARRDRERLNARLLADKYQGTHPSEAVATKPTAVKTGRMAKSAGKQWNAAAWNDNR